MQTKGNFEQKIKLVESKIEDKLKKAEKNYRETKNIFL